MVKTQTDGEDNQDADDLGPRIKAMDPGVSVEVKKNVHLISTLAVREKFE
jgi:hypothetical protein